MAQKSKPFYFVRIISNHHTLCQYCSLLIMSISELFHELQIAFIKLEIEFKDEKLIDDLNEVLKKAKKGFLTLLVVLFIDYMDRIPAQM